MNKFHFGDSFVTGEKLGQKVIYENFEIPFTLSDLKNTLINGTFTFPDGRIAEFIDIKYNFSQDFATVSVSVEDVYTDKLIETYYEP